MIATYISNKSRFSFYDLNVISFFNLLSRNVDTIWRKIIVGFCEWSKVPDNILNEGRKFNLLLEVAVNLFLFPIQHFYGKVSDQIFF